MRRNRLLLLLAVATTLMGQTWLERESYELGGTRFVREQLYYEGLPVWGEEAVRAGSERTEHGFASRNRQQGARLRFDRRQSFGNVLETDAIEAAKRELGWERAQVHFADRWWVPNEAGELRGAWRIILSRGIAHAHRVLVDASSGAIVEVHRLINRQNRGNVFNRSPISSPLTEVTLDGLGTSATLNGPLVKVYSYYPVLLGLIDESAVGTIDSQLARADSNRNFLYQPADPRFSEVQAYHGIQRASTFLQSLGISRLNRPFDVVVQYIDLESPYAVNAFFSPVLSNNRGAIVMQTNLLGADTTLDSSILFHEFGHATVHAVVNSLNSSKEFDAVNEAFADYFAATYFSNAAIGEFFPYLSPSPNFLTRQSFLRTLDNQTAYPANAQGEPHADSLMFSGALWDMRKALGQSRADAIAFGGLARMTAQMGFYSASEAIVAAANALYGPAVRDQVRTFFTNRGLNGSTARYSEQSQALTSGQIVTSDIPANPSGVRYYLSGDDYRIDVPRGAVALRVQVEASGPVRAFLRFRAPVDIENGAVIADHQFGDARVIDSAVNFGTSPELQAGTYYLNVANTSSTAVQYAVRLITSVDSIGAAASYPLMVVGSAVTGSIPARHLNTRQFRVVVPQGTTGMNIQLEGDQDVDLYVNYGAPVEPGGEGLPLAEGIAASASNAERMLLTTATVPNLRPGTYYIAVKNYSPLLSRFTLRVGFTNETAYAASVDNVPSTETRQLFLPTSTGTNTGVLLTRQLRIDTLANWSALSLRFQTNSNVLVLIKRGSPVRFNNGIPDAEASLVLNNETRTFPIDATTNLRFQQGAYYIAFLSVSDRGGTVGFSYTPTISAVAAPVITAVVDGASGQRQIAPGSWVTVFGTGFSPQARSWAGADFIGTALPTTVEGISVSIGGLRAYVAYVSPTQLNVLVPQSLRTGSATVVVSRNGITSAPAQIPVVTVVPAFFTIDGKYIAAVSTAGQLIAPNGLFGNSRPAAKGEVILLFATGLGAVGTADGITNEAVANITSRVTATVGGIAARVDFAGRVSPGLYQINLQVPPGVNSGEQIVRISIGGAQSQPTAAISVQ